MSVVYADTVEAQLTYALTRVGETKDCPDYLDEAFTNWEPGKAGDADLAAALWRYTNTTSCPKYLREATTRWMAPR